MKEHTTAKNATGDLFEYVKSDTNPIEILPAIAPESKIVETLAIS